MGVWRVTPYIPHPQSRLGLGYLTWIFDIHACCGPKIIGRCATCMLPYRAPGLDLDPSTEPAPWRRTGGLCACTQGTIVPTLCVLTLPLTLWLMRSRVGHLSFFYNQL